MVGKSEILLDIDEKVKPEDLAQRVAFLEHVLGCRLDVGVVRETKKGYHVYITSSVKFSDVEIVLLQALLGSDFRRETFNYSRVKCRIRKWNTLFEAKWRRDGKPLSCECEVPYFKEWYVFYKNGREIRRLIAGWVNSMERVFTNGAKRNR